MDDFGCSSFSEGFDYTIPPLFKDIDFWFWKARMTSFIKATDFHMWNVFTNVFDFKPRKDWTEKEMKMFLLNIRAMKILYSALTENDFEKIKCCSSAKQIWDTLDFIYASNNCVEVESVDSSSEISNYTSTSDEQLEIEEGEIIEYLHDPVNTKDQENEDSQEELMDGCDQSLFGAQDTHVVNNSNSSCVVKKNDFEHLHKIVFQPITDSILKNKNVFNHAGKSCGKNECLNDDYLKSYSRDQHNTCKNVHNKHHFITCNYCGKSGHISYTCYIRRNSTVRNKFVWVPKGQSRSNTNRQGPKYKWVPKCPSSTPCVQDDLNINGHQGTEKRKKKPRVSHAPMKKIIASISSKRTLRAPIAGITKSTHKEKQWIQTRRVCSTSRTNYHRVPFNYLEENMKRRISQRSNRRLLKSISLERALPTPMGKHMKNQWVSKVNPPST